MLSQSAQISEEPMFDNNDSATVDGQLLTTVQKTEKRSSTKAERETTNEIELEQIKVNLPTDTDDAIVETDPEINDDEDEDVDIEQDKIDQTIEEGNKETEY